jgi:hypothetical protein
MCLSRLFQSFLSPEAAKCGNRRQSGVKIRAILNEIIASAMELSAAIEPLREKKLPSMRPGQQIR